MVDFVYKPFLSKNEILKDGRKTGNYDLVYGTPVEYEGNIAPPSAFATNQLFGVETKYTHVLLMDDPDADIQEDGLIECKGKTYEIKAVRPSLNVLAVALKQRTENSYL